MVRILYFLSHINESDTNTNFIENIPKHYKSDTDNLGVLLQYSDSIIPERRINYTSFSYLHFPHLATRWSSVAFLAALIVIKNVNKCWQEASAKEPTGAYTSPCLSCTNVLSIHKIFILFFERITFHSHKCY